MEWPPETNKENKSDVLEVSKISEKENELMYGEHEVIGGYDFYPEKMEVIGNYKNIKDDDFSELVKQIANANSIKISQKNKNGVWVQITGEDLRTLKKENRENKLKLSNSILKALTQNRLARPTQNLGQFFEMKDVEAQYIFNLKPGQMDNWHQEYNEILKKYTTNVFDPVTKEVKPKIEYDEVSAENKEKMADELDSLLRKIYEEHLGIKSEEKLFNKPEIKN